MASRLKVPKLGMSMTDGTIAEWLVSDGDVVDVGQPLYLLETDKTQVEVPSPVAGVITLVGRVNETYEIGAVVAEIN